MILKGSQRGGARNLALHLLKEENDHVEVHALRGFSADDLPGALNEAYAVSRGTRCKQFMFHVAFNPPPEEEVKTEVFEAAIKRVEDKFDLSGQPCAIVFHEKEGRRHAHAVWSRIDTDEMKAVQLSYYKNKLQAVSRDLYLEHGWKMPRGLANSEERDPRNFTLAEWQQAKRIGKDPRETKAAIQDAWATSDTRATFVHALEERGFRLARGDRRGFVAIDHHGEVYAVAKSAGIKTRAVRDRLGDASRLPSVAETKEQIASDMLSTVQHVKAELDAQTEMRRVAFERRRKALVDRQRLERQGLHDRIEQRRIEEAQIRQSRFRPGFKGIWDRLRGEHRRIQEQNEREAQAAHLRDREQRDALIVKQLNQRRALKQQRATVQEKQADQKRALADDTARYDTMKKSALEARRADLERLRQRSTRAVRPRRRDRDFGMDV